MPVHGTGLCLLLIVICVPAAANELPNGYPPSAMTAEEANFRAWENKSCQEIEATWWVCTNEDDDNHAFIMENCPFTCAQARGEVVYTCPKRDDAAPACCVVTATDTFGTDTFCMRRDTAGCTAGSVSGDTGGNPWTGRWLGESCNAAPYSCTVAPSSCGCEPGGDHEGAAVCDEEFSGMVSAHNCDTDTSWNFKGDRWLTSENECPDTVVVGVPPSPPPGPTRPPAPPSPPPGANSQCSTSHPHECSSYIGWFTDPKYFHGPCCDKEPDCVCDWYCGEGCDDGAHALPHEPVPVGEPDASCKVSAGTVGNIIYGVNWGGLHVCTSDGTADGPLLTGVELAEACLAVCLADPQCRSFDIGSPKIADAYRAGQGHGYNCGIQYHDLTDPAVQSVHGTRAPVGSDAAKEVSCWTGYQMEGTCTTQPEWAPDKAVKCFDPSAALGGGVAGRTSIGGGEEWFDAGGMVDPVYQDVSFYQDVSYLARLHAIDATCDGWTVDGAPAIHVHHQARGEVSVSPSPPPSPQLTVLKTTVALKATTDGTLDDASTVAALAEELGVDAERITLVPSFDGALEAGAEAEVKVVVEVEDVTAVEAVEEKLGEMKGTDAFGPSFQVTAVADVVVTRPAPPSPPPADICDCDDAAANDECKETCDAIRAAVGNSLGIAGAALTLVIVLPIVGCLLVALLVALVVYCCCCKGKTAAAGAPAQPIAVVISTTAV